MTDLALTSEGGQELLPANLTNASEALRERGAVLRMTEAESQQPILNEDPEDERMIMNMGPQHPSTHGVLRLMLELQGETVLRVKPVVGYLHTGMEWTGEELTYLQGCTNVTRMDYASPLFNELAFSLTVEKLLGVEVPARAVWIRMLMTELNRMASHLLFMATNGMDLGAVGMMLYGWREREEVLRFFEKVTGLRMNHNYIRPGGVAADLPDGWRDDVLRLLDLIPPRLDEYDVLLTGQPIWRERLQGVGLITAEECVTLGVTGPILRSTGYAWDLRRDNPYLAYDEVDFDVVIGTYGDCFDRYVIRLNEIRESIRIVHQVLDKMPPGDYRVQDRKVTPPPRARIDESMEALIHHFKIFTEGYKVPEGEAYCAVESPRGELGCYIVSDGSSQPYRMHIRGPSFVNLQSLPHMMHGGFIADGVAVISSVDPIMGESIDDSSTDDGACVMARLSTENVGVAKEIIARYPRPKSALIPLLHLAEEQDGYVTDEAMAHIGELVGVTAAEVLGTCSFYEMFKLHPVGTYLVNVCTNISCMLLGADELLEHAEERLGIKTGNTTTDGTFTLEEAECIAACTEAPCLQVNYRYFGNVGPAEFDRLVDDLASGTLADTIPPHGTLARIRQHLPDDERRAGSIAPEDGTEPAWMQMNAKPEPAGSEQGSASP